MIESGNIHEFIQGATRLPALPTQISHLLSTVNDPRRSADEIGRIIMADTTLSAKVLKMANSVFYSRMGQVTTISQAIVRLGQKTVQSLVLTIWTHTLKNFAKNREELELLTGMLDHGTACAVASGILMHELDRNQVEDAFIVGLLHDIGRVAMACQLGLDYQREILSRAIKEQRPIIEVEKLAVGFNHAELGAELMRSWNLPEIFIETAKCHHDDSPVAHVAPLISSIMLADALVTQMGYNIAEESPRPGREELFEIFHLTDLEQFLQKSQERIDALAAILNT